MSESLNTDNLRRAIFIDRDGTLNEEVGYVRNLSDFRLFDFSAEAVKLINQSGWLAIVVTNQSAVGRGLVQAGTVQEINHRLATIIRNAGGQVDGIYTCPHQPLDGCDCRKPKPGLLKQAAADLNIAMDRSWMIGDAWSDLLAGQAAGVQKLAILRTGRGTEQLSQAPPIGLDYSVFNDLSEALLMVKDQTSLNSTTDRID